MNDHWHPDEGSLFDLAHRLLETGEETEILSHLEICPACGERFRRIAAERAVLRATALAATRPAAAPVDAPVRGRFGELLAMPRRFRWGTALAAGVASIVIVYVVAVNSRLHIGSEVELRTWLPNPELVLGRAVNGGTGDEALKDGFEAYVRHDAKTAARLLAGAAPPGSIDELRRLYLANSLSWENDYDGAATVLEGIHSASMPEPWKSEADWIRYVVLAKTGREASADSLLALLAGRTNAVGDRARAIR